MKNMSKVQMEDHIYDRIRHWWTVYNGCDEEELREHLSEIKGMIEYFRKQNNRFVEHRDKVLWVQMELMLSDCEVAIDNEVWDDLSMHATVIEELLGQIAKYLL